MSNFDPEPDNKPVDERWESTRTKNWFKGARRGIKAAISDMETGMRSVNPYSRSSKSEFHGWMAAYNTWRLKQKDITEQYQEQGVNLKRAAQDLLTKRHIKQALQDWEHQAKGMIRVGHKDNGDPIYAFDPSLTNEDKQFALTQAAICRKDLQRPTTRQSKAIDDD